MLEGLAESHGGSPALRPRSEHVCRAACELACKSLGVPVEKVMSGRKAAALARTRWASMWLASIANAQTREIARFFNCDPGQVSRGIKRLRDLAETQPLLARKLKILEEEFTRRRPPANGTKSEPQLERDHDHRNPS